MSSMSPPGGLPSPLPPMPLPESATKKKRGAGRGRKKALGLDGNAEAGPSTPSTRGGRGRGGGARPGGSGRGRGGGRKRKQSIQPDTGSNAGTPASMGGPTPGPTPGSTLMDPDTPGGFTPAAASGSGREASVFSSTTRRSGNTRGGQTNGDGTVAGEGDTDDEDDEDDDDNDLDRLLGDDEYDEQAKERAEAKEALRLLLDQFTPEQLARYEVYRRSGFQKPAVRRLINHVLQQSCSPNIIVAVRGLAKVFVGEVVESARQIQADKQQDGPLTPDDVRTAYMRYRAVRDNRGSQKAKLFIR